MICTSFVCSYVCGLQLVCNHHSIWIKFAFHARRLEPLCSFNSWFIHTHVQLCTLHTKLAFGHHPPTQTSNHYVYDFNDNLDTFTSTPENTQTIKGNRAHKKGTCVNYNCVVFVVIWIHFNGFFLSDVCRVYPEKLYRRNFHARNL